MIVSWPLFEYILGKSVARLIVIQSYFCSNHIASFCERWIKKSTYQPYENQLHATNAIPSQVLASMASMYGKDPMDAAFDVYIQVVSTYIARLE